MLIVCLLAVIDSNSSVKHTIISAMSMKCVQYLINIQQTAKQQWQHQIEISQICINIPTYSFSHLILHLFIKFGYFKIN